MKEEEVEMSLEVPSAIRLGETYFCLRLRSVDELFGYMPCLWA